MERAIEPIALDLIGGKQAKFLLSMGGIRRLKQRFNVKSLKDLLEHDSEEAVIAVLYEAMLDKNGMSEDQFVDLLPANLPENGKAVARLMGASFPEQNGNSRPTEAGTTGPNQ